MGSQPPEMNWRVVSRVLHEAVPPAAATCNQQQTFTCVGGALRDGGGVDVTCAGL
jgi:hypothetical protein